MIEEKNGNRPPPISDEFKRKKEKAAEAPERTPIKDKVLTDRELRGLDVPPIEWLIPNLLTFPSLTMIAGHPMSYKTAFATWMARRIVAGLSLFSTFDSLVPIHGSPSETFPKRKVLFVEEEMSLRQMKQRTNWMKTYDEDNLFFLVSDGFKLNNEECLADLKNYVRENKIDCVFFDPFSSVSGLKDENDNTLMAELMDSIRHTLIQTEDSPCSVVFIHHPAKGEKGDAIRGAGDLLGKMDQAIVLDPKNKGADGILVKWVKYRDIADRPDDFWIDLRETDDPIEKEFAFMRLDEKEEETEKKDRVEDQMIKTIKEGKVLGLERQQIADLVGLSNTGKKFRRLYEIDDS